MNGKARGGGDWGAGRLAGGLRVLSLAACVAISAGGVGAGQLPDVPPPPPPAENVVRLTEEEIAAQLPERERAILQREQNARDRFEALLEVSAMRLADLGGRVDAGAGPLADGLVLYESVLLAADERLRSPEANVKPRDKRFKKFERELNKQFALLRTIVADLSYGDAATGVAVLETVQRLRAAALNSALDVDILTAP